jgi:apolipoprotein N-acyltransferase
VLICTTILALAVLGAYVWLQSIGRENNTLLLVLVGLVGAGGFGYASHARTGQVERDMTAVKVQTNGNTSRLLDILEQQSHQLARSTPITAPVWPPASGVLDAPPEVPADAPVPPSP